MFASIITLKEEKSSLADVLIECLAARLDVRTGLPSIEGTAVSRFEMICEGSLVFTRPR